MEPFARGTLHRFLEGVLKIEAMLDELGPLGAHGSVLLGAIAMRHQNDRAQTRAARGDRHALAVVAARRRDDARDAGLAALQLVHVDEAAADLEGTNERMILVLHPITAQSTTQMNSSSWRTLKVRMEPSLIARGFKVAGL